MTKKVHKTRMNTLLYNAPCNRVVKLSENNKFDYQVLPSLVEIVRLLDTKLERYLSKLTVQSPTRGFEKMFHLTNI